MLQSAAEAEAHLETGASLLGPGWREISSFEDLSDEDEYTTDEEEIYAVMDFGQSIDRQQLQTESTYQLVGIDTPVPFIKLGNQVYQGEMSSLIGDEVILGTVRDPANPTRPSHPPLYTSSHHLLFRPVSLFPRSEPAPSVADPPDPIEKPRLGRPKGSTTKPRVIANSEAEVMQMDMGSLPDDVIIEVVQPEIPGASPVPNRRLTKHQAERLMAGLPASHQRGESSVPAPVALTIIWKRGGPKGKAGVEGSAGREDNAEAGPSNKGEPEPARTATGRIKKPYAKRPAKGKGKGKGKGEEAEDGSGGQPELPDDEAAAGGEIDAASGIPLGALYLATREPGQVKAKRGRPRKRVEFVNDIGDSEAVSAIGTAGPSTTGSGPEVYPETEGSGVTGPAQSQTETGEGDVEMQDDGDGAVDAPSPLMEIDEGGR